MRMPLALELHAVSKRFVVGTATCHGSVLVLCSVDLELACGDALAIVGSPGAGKSTLLLCAAGLLGVDAGELAWFGQSDRAIAADCATYYFAGASSLRRPRRSSAAPHLHLVDGTEALGLSTASRLSRWIEQRRSSGDAVLLTLRSASLARDLVPRTLLLRAGRLQVDGRVSVATHVAETIEW